MGYGKIFEELDDIINNEFTMDSFIKLNKLCNDVDYTYREEVLAVKSGSKNRYSKAKENVNEKAFALLKEKLGFSDYIINRILLYLNLGNMIEDIYVVDGNILVKYLPGESLDKTPTKTDFMLDDDYMDITSEAFTNENRDPIILNLLVKSLINSIKPLINSNMVDDALITINDCRAKCTLPTLNIYANHTFNEIMACYINNSSMITKFIVKYKNNLFAFKMRIHNGYIILTDISDEIYILSEKLTSKEKTLIKK